MLDGVFFYSNQGHLTGLLIPTLILRQLRLSTKHAIFFVILSEGGTEARQSPFCMGKSCFIKNCFCSDSNCRQKSIALTIN